MRDNLQQSNTVIPKLRWYEYWTPYTGLFVTWFTVHQAILFLVRLNVVGSENVRNAEVLAKERGVGIIFAMNHTNRLLDPFFAIAASSPRASSYPMFYVTGNMTLYSKYSSGFSKLIYNNFIFKILGAQYITKGKKDYSKSLARHIKLLNAGHSVCIFPEGKLSVDGNLGEAHGGVGYLAMNTGAVVVPIYTAGASSMSFKSFITRKHGVVVNYGKPMQDLDFKPTETSEKNKYQQYADIIMSHISNMKNTAKLQNKSLIK